ncbi:MAG TPA: hydrogenase formation protein HypD [Bacteroides sp.]|nr:hydrogenase formation protein HypD [Bacteroides sp.]
MKYISEYRDRQVIDRLAGQIASFRDTKAVFMEVCGTHTMSIHRFDIPSLLPAGLRLLSGPGCPVCVTPVGYMDHAIALARQGKHIIATFGDLVRVPGSTSTLEKARAEGADVRTVYSITEALELARTHPGRKVIFLAIGFETTAPATAAGVLQAQKEQLRNFCILSAHKVMPPALEMLASEGVKIDGYLCPGHVSVITGEEIYRFIPRKYGVGCVIAGFEPADILLAILLLLKQVTDGKPRVENAYKRAVRKEGNPKAREMMESVFRPVDTEWRGLGMVKKSGLVLREEFASMDAAGQIRVMVEPPVEPQGCICGQILKGIAAPSDCPLFGKMCHPGNPVGACMVSSEGTCQNAFKFQSDG